MPAWGKAAQRPQPQVSAARHIGARERRENTRHHKSRQLSVIVHNAGDQPRPCTLELPQQWLQGKTLIATLLPIGKESEKLPPVTCQGNSETFTQPAKSLLAFRIL